MRGRDRFAAGFRRAVVYGVAAFAAVCLAVCLAGILWVAGHLARWRTHPPQQTAFMTQRMEELRVSPPHDRPKEGSLPLGGKARSAEGAHNDPPHDRPKEGSLPLGGKAHSAKGAQQSPGATLQYRFVPYTRISDHLKRAMIAAEDSHFVDHEGFDWAGIQLALEKNQRRGKVVAGGSTITQQLAKNLFLSPERSYWRKGFEAVITVMLERMLDKERIFELYLNVIEWGSGVFGAEAASQRYFGIPAVQLDAEQAARLAAMAPNPRFYERNPTAPGLNRKVRIILHRMSGSDLP